MAIESVATKPDPAKYGADPVHGNFTDDAGAHLWCATALAKLVATPDAPLENFNDDIQQAIRYLLQREIERAMQAQKAEATP